MPQGSKAKYTTKQKRRAEHIEDSYEDKGVSTKEAAKRAWATVNKEDGGGKKAGSGRGQKPNRSASRKGGRKGAAARRKTSSTAKKRTTTVKKRTTTAKKRTAKKRTTTAASSRTTAAKKRSAAARKAGKASARARARRKSS